MNLEIQEEQEREGNEEYIPCDSPMDAQSFVRNRLVDADEDEDVRIHYAVLFDDVKTLQTLLEEEETKKWLDFRVRPFLATPLRLAATSKCDM
ncbi:hypothetical protein Avbf_13165 [Armadillidium vulgare]|nr:hypothetical protein Avbf_13165 [Armadillidium vulgare]